MKPQLVALDAGHHNLNPAAAALRIMEGGSWKKQRVVVVIPAGAQIPTKVALSHWNLIFPPNQHAHRMAALGMEVGEAYSNAIAAILATPGVNEWEYLLTIEHDNIPPPDGLLHLLEKMERHPEFACIGGLYWTKGECGVPQLWGDPRDPQINFRPQVPIPNTVQEVCGTGMGFNLFRLSMFRDERLARPWFKTTAGVGGVGTQDLNFWLEARKLGYRCAVSTSCLVGHFDVSTDICW